MWVAGVVEASCDLFRGRCYDAERKALGMLVPVPGYWGTCLAAHGRGQSQVGKMAVAPGTLGTDLVALSWLVVFAELHRDQH